MERNNVANRCCYIDASYSPIKGGLKTAHEIIGAGAVACRAASCSNPKISFPTCAYQCLNEHGAIWLLQKYQLKTYQCLNDHGVIQLLQKCLHLEPWNHTLRYILILNLLQKACEEKFTHYLCTMLERLIFVDLSNNCYSKTDMSHQYQKFQLLLCASEISLHANVPCICLRR